jgi:hypothetical protein
MILSIATLSVNIFSITTLSRQYNCRMSYLIKLIIMSVIVLSVGMLSVVLQSTVMLHDFKVHAECH